MIRTSNKDGFTAIELLITLFVLAAFLVASVQLYNVIINDGGSTRSEARASNVAYDYLRQFSTVTENPCSPSLPVDDQGISVAGLVDVSVTVEISCPYGTSSDVSKVESLVTYNNPSKTIAYATFALDTSEGTASSVTEGLVAWWKLNGTATDYIGSADGTVSGAVATTGQNGNLNSAYNFDGINDYIEFPIPSSQDLNSITTTVWAKATGVAQWGYVVYQGAGRYIGSSLIFIGTQDATDYYSGLMTGALTDYTSTTVGNTTTWRHLAMTYNGSTRILYVDGIAAATNTDGPITNSTSGDRLSIGSAPADSTFRPVQGDIDDVRMYDRVLTPTEIQTLFSEGAF